MKTETDTDDTFLICTINNGKCIGGNNYVFKGYKTMAKITIQIDQDGPENELQNEYCHFDAAYK